MDFDRSRACVCVGCACESCAVCACSVCADNCEVFFGGLHHALGTISASIPHVVPISSCRAGASAAVAPTVAVKLTRAQVLVESALQLYRHAVKPMHGFRKLEWPTCQHFLRLRKSTSSLCCTAQTPTLT